MTAAEAEAWENGTFHDIFDEDGDFTRSYLSIDDKTYIAMGYEVLINERTIPVTEANYIDVGVDDPSDFPMQSVVISFAHIEADVDMDGNLLYVKIGGVVTVTNIFGGISEIELNATARFSDIGTSDPTLPIPGANQLLTPRLMMTRFGSDDLNVYFKLNDDGSIDEESITTTYPGEMYP